MIDERYSSVEASDMLNQTGVKGLAQKAMLDQVAAQTILQSYFDSCRFSWKIMGNIYSVIDLAENRWIEN